MLECSCQSVAAKWFRESEKSFSVHAVIMASAVPVADPTRKVSPEDFELLSVLGTGGG